uniref:Bcl-2 Bcl-2 homology region 1-3 domain-containing protein n=1 Tax=Plectus sambesii TaxID=2011161 RepID=A0A914XNM3_9BILA
MEEEGSNGGAADDFDTVDVDEGGDNGRVHRHQPTAASAAPRAAQRDEPGESPNTGRKESIGRRQGFGGSISVSADSRERSVSNGSVETAQRPTNYRRGSAASHRSRTSSRIDYDDPAFQGSTYSSLMDLEPVTEERVESQATQVVQSFMVSSYQLDLRHERGEMEPDSDSTAGIVAETPNIPELQHYPGGIFNSTEVLIGRRLADLGDEFQRVHEAELDEMVNRIMPNVLAAGSVLKEAYSAFRKVATRLLADGSGLNWGRIVALLCFGYRMALALARHGWRNFVPDCVKLVVEFMLSEQIVRWIAQHGGWVAALAYRLPLPEGTVGIVAGGFFYALTCGALLVAIIYSLRNNK